MRVSNRNRLTPAGRGSLVISVPERGETEPLAQQRRGRLKRDGRPSDDGGRYTQKQPRIALGATETGELHAPVKGTWREINSGRVELGNETHRGRRVRQRHR